MCFRTRADAKRARARRRQRRSPGGGSRRYHMLHAASCTLCFSKKQENNPFRGVDAPAKRRWRSSHTGTNATAAGRSRSVRNGLGVLATMFGPGGMRWGPGKALEEGDRTPSTPRWSASARRRGQLLEGWLGGGEACSAWLPACPERAKRHSSRFESGLASPGGVSGASHGAPTTGPDGRRLYSNQPDVGCSAGL
jgi:hypothetical protein